MTRQDSESTTLVDTPVSRTGMFVCAHQRRQLLALLSISVVAGIVWFFWPARPNLAGFDPAAMAQLETAMWRDYYSQHWLALLGHTWRASHQQYGFSRWDSLRLAWHAARAARAFQHDTNDPAALSDMTDYYRVVAPAASATFDARKGAVWEVQWWRERRESAPPAEWAGTIAALTASIYGRSADSLQPAAEARVAAMVYRDDHRQSGLGSSEWEQVRRRLRIAYESLKQELRDTRSPSKAPLKGASLQDYKEPTTHSTTTTRYDRTTKAT
jgi:hypothetical protein